MPELPEVETIARDLNAAGLVGRTLTCARVYWDRHGRRALRAGVLPPDRKKTDRRGRPARQVPGDRFCRRRAPARCTCACRAGSTWFPAARSGSPTSTWCLAFDDGSELRFHDTRKFGRVYLMPDAERILGRLGPEPLDPDVHRPSSVRRACASAAAGG
ncbi:MAG: hypothetical protein MZV70_08685 [Desulfobacterales bacterium]|nr:hypothetical protein [Desulfobacterales bacterium]